MTEQAARAITHLHFARVTIEARTPISSGSGDEDPRYDMALARDGNGLPRLQGTSIQGVLRSLWPDCVKAKRLFGFQDRNQGQAGRIAVSDGVVHGANDTAAYGLLTRNQIEADDVLDLLAEEAPIRRDHVSLNERSVVKGRGKFERLAAPIGTRFSFEMTLWGEGGDDGALKQAIDLVGDPRFRLGGATGRGYGGVMRVRAATWSAPLAGTEASRIVAVRQTPFSNQSDPFEEHKASTDTAHTASGHGLSLRLTPVGPWRIGASGQASVTESHADRPGADPRRMPDAVPIREPAILWGAKRAENGGKPILERKDAGYLIPGASVKGVLAHRALYHFNRRRQRWANSAADVAKFSRRPDELVAIFGKERDAQGGDEGGLAGRLFIDDAIVGPPNSVIAIDHNSIDRFTGGVRNGSLFSEEVVMGGAIALSLRLLPARSSSGYDRDALLALNRAIADLCEGRLALGAKSLGFCSSTDAAPAFPVRDDPPAQGRAA